MSSRLFPRPQDAETAFYEALEAADLEAMMAVWAEDDEIVCVHPTGPRLTGHAAVRAAWAAIFEGGATMRVRFESQPLHAGQMAAVHSVLEHLSLPGDAQPRPPMIATNVYVRTPSGWRMVAHHASPAPAQAGPPPPASETPKTLH